MPKSERDVLQALTERIEVAHPAAAIFSGLEIAEWPNGVLKALVRQGLLTMIERGDTVVCLGCDAQCTKPVVVRSGRAAGSWYAFVNCDEAPDHGRISIRQSELQQFSVTLHRLSMVVATALNLSDAKASANGTAYGLGTAKGRNGPRQVYIRLEAGRLQFQVNAECVDLLGLLHWDGKALSIDKASVKRLLNRKQSTKHSSPRHVPDRGKQVADKNATAIRDRKIFSLAMQMTGREGLSITAAAETISKMKIAIAKNGKRLSAGRVRRIITEEAH